MNRTTHALLRLLAVVVLSAAAPRSRQLLTERAEPAFSPVAAQVNQAWEAKDSDFDTIPGEMTALDKQGRFAKNIRYYQCYLSRKEDAAGAERRLDCD